MISRIVTSYLYDLAKRMEQGINAAHGELCAYYDMADIDQLRDLADTLDEQRGQSLSEALSEFAGRNPE